MYMCTLSRTWIFSACIVRQSNPCIVGQSNACIVRQSNADLHRAQILQTALDSDGCDEHEIQAALAGQMACD